MSTWKVIIATLVIFIAGALTGGLLVTNTISVINTIHPAPAVLVHPQTNGLAGNPAPIGNPWLVRSRELLRRMDRELSLTADQHQRIEALITHSQERTRDLWKPIAPAMNKEFQFLRVEIREQLNPEQQSQYDELLKVRILPSGHNGRGTNAPPLAQTNLSGNPESQNP